MAKCSLRKPETDEWRRRVGAAVDGIRQAAGLNLQQFAGQLSRDERQVARWISGEEHAQVAAIFAVPAFRQPLVVAFAQLAGDGVQVRTTITVERIA